MSLVSIHLPDDVGARLASEAARAQRPKSEIARDAIVNYLDRLERERFLADIARAAWARGDDQALELADEALASDNESLEVAEGVGARRMRHGLRKRAARKKKSKH